MLRYSANRGGRGPVTLSYKSELDKIVEDIVARIRNGSLKPGDVDPKLYELVGAQLYQAVEQGYDVTLENATKATDVEMLKALRANVYRFSGFKNYHFVLDANALLVDADGQLKPFDKFRQDILSLNKEYNINHLRTEYNHAVATSQMAGKWQQFTHDAGTLPLLEYVTVGDDRTRASHQVFDGVIKPVHDAFWDKHMPPLDYNCRCTVRQLADGEITARTDFGEPKPGFGVNWGKQRVVFPPSHPQFTVLPEDQKNADENFGLTIPN